MQVRPCLRERKERRDVKRGPCYSWERIKNWDKSWGSFIIGQKCPLRSKCTLFRKRSLPPGFWIAHLGENCLGVQARKKKRQGIPGVDLGYLEWGFTSFFCFIQFSGCVMVSGTCTWWEQSILQGRCGMPLWWSVGGLLGWPYCS